MVGLVTPHLIIPPQTELLGIAITLQPQTDFYLRPQYPTALHGWFLDRVRSTNPTLSQQLHDGQAEKPFTISGFAEDIPVGDRQLFLSADRSYQWHITTLSAPLCDWLREWLMSPPPTLRLNSTTCKIADWQIASPPTTYAQIWHQAATDNTLLQLTFTSPTSFRKRGNHMPLPIPENLFHSYLRRWNHFAIHPFEQEPFLEWVNDNIVILRHDIRSCKVPAGKSGSVTGFIGSVQLGLTTKANQQPEYSQLVRALIACAPYFHTGHKVTFGLGQTQSGWDVGTVSISVAPLDRSISTVAAISNTEIITARAELIKARELELAPLFLSQKKRQGGDRARNTAKLWAQIVARQELGDSLIAIAADLKMPYDTVKKYVRLAKQQML
jgi:CRISPR-associated endoribonuclease Cas6